MMKFHLFLYSLFFINSNSAQSSQDIIKINQSGYYTAAPKVAMLTSDFSTDEYAGSAFGFYILTADVGDTVFKNKLGPVRTSTNSSIKTRIADFSSFNTPG